MTSLSRYWSVALCFSVGVSAQTVKPNRDGAAIRVPVLVESKSGQIAYGLTANDFSIKDNGVDQKVSLDDNSDVQPLALLVIIQTGHNATTALNSISGLADLLDSVLANPQDQAAILAFDGSPHLLQGFTNDHDSISTALSSLAPGSSGAALFDAIHLAILSFRKAPLSSQKVILLISEENDHGSAASDSSSLLRDSASENLSLYSLSFTPDKKNLFGGLRRLNPVGMIGSNMRANPVRTLADITGGESYRFNNQRGFEDHMSEIASHIHNRYNLVFQPLNPHPGLHSLDVEVRVSKTNVVAARSVYWGPDGSESPHGAE